MTIDDWFSELREEICDYVAKQEIPEIPTLREPFRSSVLGWAGDASNIGQTRIDYGLVGLGEELYTGPDLLPLLRVVLLAECRGVLTEPDSQVSDGCGEYLVLNAQQIAEELGHDVWASFTDSDLAVIFKTLCVYAGIYQRYERRRDKSIELVLNENAVLTLALLSKQLVKVRRISNDSTRYMRGWRQPYDEGEFDN